MSIENPITSDGLHSFPHPSDQPARLLSHFDYDLDPSLIATEPLADRDQSRLLIYDRQTQKIEHRRFHQLTEYLNVSDLLVVNDTRVFPARLRALDQAGKEIEFLLLRPLPEKGETALAPFLLWEVLAKGKHKTPVDLKFPGEVRGTLVRDLGGGRRALQLDLPGDRYDNIYDYLETWGEVPLPPYILRQREKKKQEVHPEAQQTDTKDHERYQTLYAEHWGSAAAPTAGLHFSKALMEQIKVKGVQRVSSTLHIGLDTFQPIRSESLSDHQMHKEWFEVSTKTAKAINATRQRGGRVVAVGTSVTRALESTVYNAGEMSAKSGNTDLFITPGYVFKGIDALITNFHLPKSTLLVMISAFAGEEAIKKIYREAIQHRYRFYSYGDAMLIL